MAEKLGKIDKPEAGQFATKRKLFLVPLLFCGENAPDDYQEKFNRYWQQITERLASLEAKIGLVNHVYLESITLGGEEGLKVLEKINPPCYRMINDKCQQGAAIEATEDKELAEEAMDWERFLYLGFISHKVADQVTGLYLEASRKRYEHIARRLDETLPADKVGLLLIRENHGVQFPPDIEVFSVAPPVLDEIHRWQRQRVATTAQESDPDQDEPTKEE